MSSTVVRQTNLSNIREAERIRGGRTRRRGNVKTKKWLLVEETQIDKREPRGRKEGDGKTSVSTRRKSGANTLYAFHIGKRRNRSIYSEVQSRHRGPKETKSPDRNKSEPPKKQKAILPASDVR